MGVFFFVVGIFPLLTERPVKLWATVLSGSFIIVSLVGPSLLAPLNQSWFKFGLFLHKLTSPIIMGLAFYLLIAPIGMARRLFGLDTFCRGFDPAAKSYWIEREPPGPKAESLKNQF